jgi:isopentenyldiphosphate isomerase
MDEVQKLTKLPHDPYEMLDIVNDKDEVIGQHMRKKYVDGKLHRQVSVFLLNRKGELLVQVRSDNQKLDPSSSGHVSSGQNYLESAIRETKEELGLNFDKSKFREIGKFRIETKHAGITVNQRFMTLFVVRDNINIEDIKFDPGEVRAVKYVTLDHLEQFIHNHGSKATKALKRCLKEYLAVCK